MNDVTQELTTLSEPKTVYLQKKLYRKPNKFELEEQAEMEKKRINPFAFPTKIITVEK